MINDLITVFFDTLGAIFVFNDDVKFDFVDKSYVKITTDTLPKKIKYLKERKSENMNVTGTNTIFF